ncbi:uncharacterized protein HGUI_03080 [Hanseniaspora guilliermondii]|uniref:Uncharacterized protein n=1 Tax=Hanseniaspora guilliermondii TaxID=56406 RepID=A0A1L0B325_9ASCO|nr:uncharacterized protein HGUI_03080 [Hanseniaspora guilliermondii]
MSNNDTISKLQEQVNQLTSLVEKQNKLILSTGERLMSLEVRQQKKSISKLSGSSENDGDSSSDEEDDDGYARNEDLIQLVGELQGQLINLDYKSVNRVNNSSIKDNEPLALILNADGEEPPQDIDYPKTKNDLLSFTDIQIFKLAMFYELVPPIVLHNSDETLDKKLKELSVDENQEDSLERHMNVLLPTKKEKDELFNNVAAYLGVNVRK